MIKPILELVDEFVVNHNASTLSVEKYRQNLNIMVEWMTRYGDVKAPRRADLLQFREWLVKSGRKSYTIDSILTSVRQFFKYLEEHGYYDNIAAGITSPRRSNRFRKDHLKPEQVHRLLNSINRIPARGMRDYALINLMVRTGMRCCEVTRMNVKDLTIEDGTWVVYIQGKGRIDKDRVLGVTDMVVNPIKDYLELRDVEPDSPLFVNHAYAYKEVRITACTISRMVKARLEAVNMKTDKLTAHSLRHTAAVNALQSGAGLYDVQQMLGHSDPKTTNIYLLSIAEAQARKGGTVRLLDNIY